MTSPQSISNDQQQPKAKRTAEQNAQARLVLIQLLWLFMAFIIGALVWLGHMQKRLALQVEERLKITEAFSSRMNDMDDRLFAIAQSHAKTSSDSSPKNDLPLIAIQLETANRSYLAGDYAKALEILTVLDWQLEQAALALPAPTKAALKTAIKHDITAINTLRNQTDPWQVDMIRLRQLQRFGKSLKGNDPYQEQLLYDIDLLLTLSLGAAATREREAMVIYVQAMLEKYQQLRPFYSKSNEKKSPADNPVLQSHAINSIDDAISGLEQLIKYPPTLPALKSLALL